MNITSKPQLISLLLAFSLIGLHAMDDKSKANEKTSSDNNSSKSVQLKLLAYQVQTLKIRDKKDGDNVMAIELSVCPNNIIQLARKMADIELYQENFSKVEILYATLAQSDREGNSEGIFLGIDLESLNGKSSRIMYAFDRDEIAFFRAAMKSELKLPKGQKNSQDSD